MIITSVLYSIGKTLHQSWKGIAIIVGICVLVNMEMESGNDAFWRAFSYGMSFTRVSVDKKKTGGSVLQKSRKMGYSGGKNVDGVDLVAAREELTHIEGD